MNNGMILLISTYQNASECAALIENGTHQTVKIVDNIRHALTTLRSEEFSAVVVDENLLEATPGSFDSLAQRMNAAMPVLLDMACLKTSSRGQGGRLRPGTPASGVQDGA